MHMCVVVLQARLTLCVSPMDPSLRWKAARLREARVRFGMGFAQRAAGTARLMSCTVNDYSRQSHMKAMRMPSGPRRGVVAVHE
jgi:hypothetical protein